METYDKLKANIETVRALIEREVSTDSPQDLTDKLQDLVNMSGLSSENLANCKALWRQQQETIIDKILSDTHKLDAPDLVGALPASTLNDLIKAKAGKWEALYDYADRIDKRVSYAQDALRTNISLLKEEINRNI